MTRQQAQVQVERTLREWADRKALVETTLWSNHDEADAAVRSMQRAGRAHRSALRILEALVEA